MSRSDDHFEDSRPGGSRLEGLGPSRRGSHRPGGGFGALAASIAAVVAVVAVLGGLFLAFGNGGPAKHASDATGPPATSTGSPSPTPSASGSPTSGQPYASSSASVTGSAGASPGASAGGGASDAPATEGDSSGGPPAEGAGAGDENGLQDLPVVVLNQSGKAGLAGQTAATLKAQGWTISSVGNFRGKVPSTTVYYPDGAQAAAQALADGLPGGGRTRPVFAGISPTKLTVILAS